jgi:Uri superfamily endonuclease
MNLVPSGSDSSSMPAPIYLNKLKVHSRAQPVLLVDLPEDNGTYILVVQVSQMKRLGIGSLGEFDIIPGFYAYVGSAFGSGGLRARIGHHLESTAEPHWHIDYLLQVATPVGVWLTTANRKLEHRWAELLEDAAGFRVPILRFGSSDYHRSRSSHLFYSKRRPPFRWFQQQVMERFEGVEVEQQKTLPATVKQ